MSRGRRAVSSWALLLVVCTSGCSEDPARGFEAFYEAMADRDAEAAWQRLSTGSRAQLQAAARAQGQDDSPRAVLQQAALRSTLSSLRVVSSDGVRAVVEVKDALGKSEQVTLVLEDGRWRLDLGAPPAP